MPKSSLDGTNAAQPPVIDEVDAAPTQAGPIAEADEAAASELPSAGDTPHPTSHNGPLYMHPFSPLGLLEAYRLCTYGSDRQYYVSALPAVAKAFIGCYRVNPSHQLKNIVLWLVDSGASCFLSPDDRHFFIQVRCQQDISGIGNQVAHHNAAVIISVAPLDVKRRWIVIQAEPLYHLPDLPFPIASAGVMDRLGFVFVLREINLIPLPLAGSELL